MQKDVLLLGRKGLKVIDNKHIYKYRKIHHVLINLHILHVKIKSICIEFNFRFKI